MLKSTNMFQTYDPSEMISLSCVYERTNYSSAFLMEHIFFSFFSQFQIFLLQYSFI